MYFLIMRMEPALYESHETIPNEEQFPDNPPCRICLEPSPYLQSPFCDCRGNLRSIHLQCLLEWAKKAKKFFDKDKNIYFICEICKSRVFLELSRSCKRRSCSKCCDRQSFSERLFGSLLTTIIVAFVLMAICLLLIFTGNEEWSVRILAIIGGCVGIIAILALIAKGMW